MISAVLALPSTPMEWVRRFTEQTLTPSSALTAFSTRALQAAQLMPVTVNCSMDFPPFRQWLIR